MAVWGTPTATEDDAERAVRAALDLVAAVVGARRRGRRARAAGAGRRADRRGGGDDRRRGRGDGRRRPRQHRVAGAVGRRAGHGVRRRVDAARDRADGRLRGRRRVRAEGQGRADAALAGAARRLGRARLAQVDRASRRRSSAATGSCARSRISSTPAPTSARRTSSRSPASPGSASRGSAWEFYKYFDGLAAAHVLAPRPLPRLRRGRHLLGARRHGADALPDRRGRGAGLGARRSCARRSRSTSPTPEERRFVEPRLAQLLGLGRARRRATGRTCSRPGGSSSSGSPTSTRRCSRSRTCSGRTRALLDFVEYLLEWSRNSPLYVITLARPGAARAAADLGRRPAQLQLALPRAAAGRRRWRSCSPGSCPACRPRCASRSSRAPRACRCTRSRRCGCCSTAACSSRRAPVYRPVGEIDALEVPETLHALIAARLDGLSPDERRLLQDAAVLGKTFTRAGARGARRAAETELEPLLAVARAQGGARRAGRSALAGARPVRLPAGPRPARRLRDARRSASAAARHLAAAEHLTHAFAGEEDEVVEVIASHYLAAYEAGPDADDAAEIKAEGPRDAGARRASAPRRSARPPRRSATSSRRPS